MHEGKPHRAGTRGQELKCLILFFPLIFTAAFLWLLSRGHAAEAPNGSAVFLRYCASCHSRNSGTRAPELKLLRRMSRESILRTLDSGDMKFQARKLSPAERIAVAEYLGTAQAAPLHTSKGFCVADPPLTPKSPYWDGWGASAFNSRFQTRPAAQLTAQQVSTLKLKWAFGFPGAWATYGQPTAFGGRVSEGSEDGTVYSLDARTGCVYWTFKADATVKTAVVMDPQTRMAFFGDTSGNVYAVDAGNGHLVWKKHVDPHPAARITGSPVFAEHRLYVPVSSGEEGAAIDPKYPCCTFRGSIVTLNPRTGETIWKSYTIPNPAERTGRRNSTGTELWGPSGAAVWSSPTVDLKRGALYVATGNSYSDPATPYADAILAFSLANGKMLWSHQLTPNDRWNSSCLAPDRANCPQKPGADFDFGSPPILISQKGGRGLLLASQKSGVVYAMDPDRKGAIVWERRIAQGGPLGGIQWGGATTQSLAFYPRSDWSDSNPAAGGGMFALRLGTGEVKWFQPPPKPDCLNQPGCSAAQMAPATIIPGVVFEGSLDGHLRAYRVKDGKVIWDFDTAQTFKTVNGVDARGGSLVATGPLVVGGMLYINSGYTNAMPGNVLLAFAPDGGG